VKSADSKVTDAGLRGAPASKRSITGERELRSGERKKKRDISEKGRRANFEKTVRSRTGGHKSQKCKGGEGGGEEEWRGSGQRGNPSTKAA